MNVTLSVDDLLLQRARKLAQSRGTSLNQMIRDLLEEATSASASDALLTELEAAWAKGAGDSEGRTWRREDLYDRPVLR